MLVVFGLIYVVTESSILAGPRSWLASRGLLIEVFLYCAYCVGFWAGALLELVWYRELSLRDLLFNPLLSGCLVMGAIAVIRAFAPAFLQGAWEREKPIIHAIRDHRNCCAQEFDDAA